MANIFILEDDNSRMITFRKNFIGHNIFHAEHVEDGKKILLEENIDYIFLDHDLGGEVYVDSKEPDTGYQMAKWISDNNISYDRLIVHSLNFAGARNIKGVIPDAEIIPFYSLF